MRRLYLPVDSPRKTRGLCPGHAARRAWPRGLARYNAPAMPRRKAPEDLSVEELRRLLIEKRRGTRRERLEHFRRTGRVVAPDLPDTSANVVETPEPDVTADRRQPASPRRRVMD